MTATSTETPPAECPVCSSRSTHVFFTQRDVPTQAGYLAPTRDEALDAPLGDITLTHCRACSHIWNSSFDNAVLNFNAGYQFSQYHSARYGEYVADTIRRLDCRYGLEGKTALDIGCGKGDYMRMLLAAGVAHTVGFDPTFGDEVDAADRSRMTIHKRFYGVEDDVLTPDLVTCRSVLQYVPAPRELLGVVRKALRDRSDTVVYFEVPNGAEAFREGNVWYVMYEAGCFFSAASLARLFRECGFDVVDILEALGASQLEIEARPSDGQSSRWESAEAIAEIDRQVSNFAQAYRDQVTEWSARFAAYGRESKRVVLWGAGMRAISLLTVVAEAADVVDSVVDVNPHRQGRFLPKTAHPVIAPGEVASARPDVVVITNPNYANEIRGQVAALGVHPRVEVLR